jgi:hypothetical protein
MPAPVKKSSIARSKTKLPLLRAALANAAAYTGKPVDEVYKTALAESRHLALAPSSATSLKAGRYLLTCRATPAGPAQGIARLSFTNKGRSRVAVLFETDGPDGVSQGFTYNELGPGDVMEFRHNLIMFIVPVVIIGGLLLGEFVKAETNVTLDHCNCAVHWLLPNECVGHCDTGKCKSTKRVSYGLVFTEPVACDCQ